MSIYEARKDLYPIVVEFEKTLAKGVLNGLTVTDKIHFPSEKEANLPCNRDNRR